MTQHEFMPRPVAGRPLEGRLLDATPLPHSSYLGQGVDRRAAMSRTTHVIVIPICKRVTCEDCFRKRAVCLSNITAVVGLNDPASEKSWAVTGGASNASISANAKWSQDHIAVTGDVARGPACSSPAEYGRTSSASAVSHT